MKTTRPISLVLLALCLAFAPQSAFSQTPEIDALKEKSEKGDVDAQFRLGSIYFNGDGVPENRKEAVKWLRKAAEQGHSFAQYALGHLYAKGESVPEDDKEAVKWYRKAAEQGHANAQNNLGRMFYNGEGVPGNYAEAYKWFNLAAAQGDELAKKNKANIARKMTPQQIAEAQRLSAAFKPR